MAKSIGDGKLSLPFHMVLIQLKIFTPVGTAMNMVEDEDVDLGMAEQPEEVLP
jgi:hypothetical protein